MKRSSQISVDSRGRFVITETFKHRTQFSAERSSAPSIKYSDKKTTIKKTVLEGKWSLTPEYDLRFRVRASRPDIDIKEIFLRGAIEKIDSAGITLSVDRCDGISGIKRTTVRLAGRWRADKNNRITFQATKSDGTYDMLTFQGAWQVGANNELIYRYKETSLKSRLKTEKMLIFSGHWDIGKNRIAYRMDRNDKSFFSFKASLGSKSLRASSGKIKFNVGIKFVSKNVYREKRNAVTIFGTWKLDKNLRVGFETAYSRIKRHKMYFQIDELFGTGGNVTVSLKTTEGERLGFKVSFEKAFKNDGELFLSLSRSREESRIAGGLRVKF